MCCLRYITKVEGEMMWVTFSEHVRGRLHALDTSSNLQQLMDWEKRLPLGSCVACTVAQASLVSACIIHAYATSCPLLIS